MTPAILECQDGHQFKAASQNPKAIAEAVAKHLKEVHGITPEDHVPIELGLCPCKGDHRPGCKLYRGARGA